MSAIDSHYPVGEAEYGAVDAGIFTCDLKRNLLFADSAFAQLFGVDEALAARGLPLETYLSRIHEHDRPRVARSIFNAIAETRPQQEEYRAETERGVFIRVVEYGRSFVDQTGDPVLFSGIVVPATQIAGPANPH